MSASSRRNLITDVAHLSVGHGTDHKLRSGVTVLIPDAPVTAAIDVRGGAPGTRDTDALHPASTVDQVHAIVLSGGSAFGLSAASGVQSWLRERGTGFRLGPVEAPAIIPIVPQAILFDLLNGGDKDWGERSPYENLALQACKTVGRNFNLGSVGAGTGATCANVKGGLGSASDMIEGITIGALAAVNPVGQVTIGNGPQFWAAPFERENEFGGLGFPANISADDLAPRLKGGGEDDQRIQNTTLAIIATDAALSKAQCHRLAVMAQTGLARAIYPVHTPLDGDTVFALATGVKSFPADPAALARLGALAANTLARAIARGVYEAAPAPLPAQATPAQPVAAQPDHTTQSSPVPCWRERFG